MKPSSQLNLSSILQALNGYLNRQTSSQPYVGRSGNVDQALQPFDASVDTVRSDAHLPLDQEMNAMNQINQQAQEQLTPEELRSFIINLATGKNKNVVNHGLDKINKRLANQYYSK